MDNINHEPSTVLVDPKKIYRIPYSIDYGLSHLEVIQSQNLKYQLFNGMIQVRIDISFPDDITKALSERPFETRSFQACREELWNEWCANSDGSHREIAENSKNYHIKRIAYFVSHSEDLEAHPLHIKPDRQSLWDGLHRVWAAIYLGRSEIKAYIFENKEDSDNWHKENSI